ncbi:cation-translocating P-type ATPase [Patescibacteria group bacterium]|nr:cation-translocating P-type ATPase [Patescibacteria group bacterium]
MIDGKKEKRTKTFMRLNLLLCFILVLILLFYFFKVPFLRNENILIVVAVIATSKVFIGAIKSLKEKKISVDLLASIALGVSLIEKEWVSAIFINLMIISAGVAIDYVKIKSHSAINSLLKLKPKKARIEKDGKIVEIPIEKVKKGDRVIIKLGERVPVDGFIEDGEAEIDQSLLTGESISVSKKKGDEILSSTTVVSGNLIIRAERVGEETTFEKIIALVEQSQANKAPIYTLINKFANWYIVLTILGASIVYLLSRNVNLVLGVLLVSCADDIVIATPLALMSAITHSAKHGAIVKGGDFLEGLSKLKIIVFDKTGTLTKSRLKVEEVRAFNEKSQAEVLRLATAVSFFSTHPIAKTIVNYTKKENYPVVQPINFNEYGGKGMTATLKDQKIITGKLSFFREMKIKMTEKEITEIENKILEGFNVTLIECNDELIGFISLMDELRHNAKEIINEFKKLGIEKIVMLTGDNEKVAQKTAEQLGINEFHANLLPEDKLTLLKKYLNKKYKVAMVGDGVNDAPVLALSDIGIAMGNIGSDVAIETADIVMVKDDLSQIPELIKIGRSTMGVIHQNLIIWGILNVLGLSLVFLHVINPSGAAAYNFITDFIPIFNSLRLFRR